MKINQHFDGLPDFVSPRTWVVSPRKPEYFTLSETFLQRYKRDFASTGSAHPLSQDPFFSNRVYNANMFVLPFLTEALDTTSMRALEVGSGDGAISAVLSQAFRQYVGLDRRPDAVWRAEQFCKKMGVTNAHFYLEEAADLTHFFARQDTKFDVIILNAVVEHLLPEERFSVLRTCWDVLDDDGYLFIGEAPSSITHADWHSSYMLYFQQMPIEMWPYFYEASSHVQWKKIISESVKGNDLILKAFRGGVSVGFREFEKGLSLPNIDALRSYIIADNYNVFMMNKSRYDRFDFLKLCEIRQTKQYVGRPDVDLPDMFSRHYLDVLLKKKPIASPASDWVVIALNESAYPTSEMVVEGRDILPLSPLTIELPSRLREKRGTVDVMLQVLRPGDGGVLSCETQAGANIFERVLWQSMRQVSSWRGRMVYQLPPLLPSDFPIKIFANRRKVTLSYAFFRSRGPAEVNMIS